MSVVDDYLGAPGESAEKKIPSIASPEKARSKGGSRRRTAEAVFQEVKKLIGDAGVKRCAFYTLTFADGVRNHVEAQRRWNSLRTNCLRHRWDKAVVVSERDKAGRIHFHAIAVLTGSVDLKGAFDFHSFDRANAVGHLNPQHASLSARYISSATHELRAEWKFWRENASRFGFGRVQVSPLKSEIAAARYVAKYLTKASNERCADDENARLVRFIGYREERGRSLRIDKKTGKVRTVCLWSSLRTRLSNGWAWCTKGGAIWRYKAAWAASMIPGVTNETNAAEVLGSRWAFILGQLGQLAPIQCLPQWLRGEENARQARRGLRYAEILAEVESALEFAGRSFDLLCGTPFHPF